MECIKLFFILLFAVAQKQFHFSDNVIGCLWEFVILYYVFYIQILLIQFNVVFFFYILSILCLSFENFIHIVWMAFHKQEFNKNTRLNSMVALNILPVHVSKLG